MSETLTHSLATFVSGLRLTTVPALALTVVRTGFTDCVGTMIAGSVEDPPNILHKTLAPAAGDASLYLTGPRLPAPDAAWINATAAHALDYDDVALRGHPSTVLVPAILAEGESLGATGARMATAYIVGYEVWAELASRDPAQHHQKGWHPTGIFGAIAAAAACASLHGLDTDKATHAIALGASHSSGLVANFGTMTKPYHAGRAAHSGVMSARLAAAGFTGSPDALEHPLGFLGAVSPKGEADGVSPAKVGQEWQILTQGLSVKKYPLCYCTHRAIDGILDLLAQQTIKPDDVESIRVSTSGRNATILRNSRPQTGLEAKFSMQFAMASAIVAGRVGLAELTDLFVQRSEIQALMSKVAVEPDDREDPKRPGAAPFDLVVIETRDGRRFESAQITDERGSPDRPLSTQELWAKFASCLSVGNPKLEARTTFDALMQIDRQPSVAALRGSRPEMPAILHRVSRRP
jgi:2-methylcitrate dehydratase PrpD